ncbi:hypothetical protein HPP92_027200 [Vanilla planifolia]|uniref:Uncharacterized protein n=1 Tax=Vanilla planifolia TaxID=51239 RepID=A0A835PCI8_VANPL|nr:hypothetical protein HPP92_027200 [Vanilla planifolia]
MILLCFRRLLRRVIISSISKMLSVMLRPLMKAVCSVEIIEGKMMASRDARSLDRSLPTTLQSEIGLKSAGEETAVFLGMRQIQAEPRALGSAAPSRNELATSTRSVARSDQNFL